MSALLSSGHVLPPLLKAKIAVPAPQPSMAPHVCKETFIFLARENIIIRGRKRSFSFRTGEDYCVCVLRWALLLLFFLNTGSSHLRAAHAHPVPTSPQGDKESCFLCGFLGTFFFFYGFERQGEEKKVEPAPSVSSAAASMNAPPLTRKLSRGCSYLGRTSVPVQPGYTSTSRSIIINAVSISPIETQIRGKLLRLVSMSSHLPRRS